MKESTKNKKDELANQIIEMMNKDMYNYHSLIFDLVKEALLKKSINELKQLL